MGGRKGGRRPDTNSAARAMKICPSCQGDLVFESKLPEGFCPECGIYVQVLGKVDRSPKEKVLPGLVRSEVKGAVKADLEKLSRTHGLKTSGKRTDLTARLLRYQELRDAAAASQPQTESERGIARRGLLLFLLSQGMDRKVAEALASLFGSLQAFQVAAADDVELLAGVSAEEAIRIREASANWQPTPPPSPADVSQTSQAEGPAPDLEPIEVPPAIVEEVEAPPVEDLPAATRDSTVSFEVAPSNPVEPLVLVEPAPAPEPVAETEPEPEPTAWAATRAEAPAHATTAPALRSRRLGRDRWILYLGTALQAIGGFGLIFGSLLHDVFRVPWFGTNFATFGSMNAAFAVGGVILLMAGLSAIGFSLRGGVARSGTAPEV